MPDAVQDVFGRAILDLEFGDTPTGAKPWVKACYDAARLHYKDTYGT